MAYYERRLPHWQPEGASFFVTWRLFGSLPRAKMLIKASSSGKAFLEMDTALDSAATGPLWLQNREVASGVRDVLVQGAQEWGLYDLRAWVLMPNHVHVLLRPSVALPRALMTIKSASARCANRILDRVGKPFWQDESYDHWVRNSTEEARIIRYIEHNPVKAGWTDVAEHWPLSSAWQGMALPHQGRH
jgi:putative transposase